MSADADELLSRIEATAAALTGVEGAQRAALQRDYLEAIGHFLLAQGRGDKIAFPLLDLIEHLEEAPGAPAPQVERRSPPAEASEQLLSQVAAVIDILITAGYSLDHACQVVTRQMMARAIKVPAGGDVRAWRNLQAWRQRVIALKPEPVWSHYQSYKDELLRAYGSRLAEAAAREAIWDRRVPTKSSQPT